MLAPEDGGLGTAIELFSAHAPEGIPEFIRGKPKAARLQRTYKAGQRGDAITEELDYDETSRVIERRIYRPDGSLLHRESVEYGPNQRTIRTLNDAGIALWTRQIFTGIGAEESVVKNATGEVIEKTTKRFDSDGRVLEAASVNLLLKNDARIRFEYDAGQVQTYLDFTQASVGTSNLHLVFGAEHHYVGRLGPSGAVHEISGTLRRYSAIESTDPEGNWATVTIYERGQTGGEDVVVALIKRSIAYY